MVVAAIPLPAMSFTKPVLTTRKLLVTEVNPFTRLCTAFKSATESVTISCNPLLGAMLELDVNVYMSVASMFCPASCDTAALEPLTGSLKLSVSVPAKGELG